MVWKEQPGKRKLPGKVGFHQLSVSRFRVMKEGKLRAQGSSSTCSPCPTATGDRGPWRRECQGLCLSLGTDTRWRLSLWPAPPRGVHLCPCPQTARAPVGSAPPPPPGGDPPGLLASSRQGDLGALPAPARAGRAQPPAEPRGAQRSAAPPRFPTQQ